MAWKCSNTVKSSIARDGGAARETRLTLAGLGVSPARVSVVPAPDSGRRSRPGEGERAMRETRVCCYASLAAVATLAVMAVGPARALGAGAVMPNAVSMVDCNGHSPVYRAVKPGLGGLCADPIEIER